MVVWGDSSEEVGKWFVIIIWDRALGTVCDHHRPVVLAHPGDGLHRVGAGGTKDTHGGGEPGDGLGPDDVNEPRNIMLWQMSFLFL